MRRERMFFFSKMSEQKDTSRNRTLFSYWIFDKFTFFALQTKKSACTIQKWSGKKVRHTCRKSEVSSKLKWLLLFYYSKERHESNNIACESDRKCRHLYEFENIKEAFLMAKSRHPSAFVCMWPILSDQVVWKKNKWSKWIWVKLWQCAKNEFQQ